jgi:outer membrane protein TolC
VTAQGGGLRTVVVLLLALVIGGAAGIASERVQDAKTRNQLIQNAQSERALLKTRADLAREELADAQRRFEIGSVGRDVVEDAKRRVAVAETALARLDMDLQEIQKTAASPRDELNAPVVGAEDFVGKRLRLDLAAAEQELRAAEAAFAEARRRVEVGMGTHASLLQPDTDLALARNRLQQVRMRLELRQKYLQDRLTAEQLGEMLRRAELALEAELTRQQYTSASARLKSIQAMVEIGTSTPLDFKRAEIQLLELELKLQRIQQQLAALKKEE